MTENISTAGVSNIVERARRQLSRVRRSGIGVTLAEEMLSQALDIESARADALAAVIEELRDAVQRNGHTPGIGSNVAAILETSPATVLAQRDARVKAAALREFADAVRMPWQVFQGDAGQVIRVGDLLREAADRIERKAQP